MQKVYPTSKTQIIITNRAISATLMNPRPHQAHKASTKTSPTLIGPNLTPQKTPLTFIIMIRQNEIILSIQLKHLIEYRIAALKSIMYLKNRSLQIDMRNR
jgi:hypothetical protein